MKVRKGFRLAGTAVSAWLATASLASAAPSADEGQPDFGSGTGIGYLIWVIVALLLVIGLIVLLIKWLASRNRGWGTNKALRSLGGIPLGQNKSLQVVELSGRLYVVGVGEDITMLDKIDDPEAVAAILNAIEQQNGRAWNPPTMAEWLGRLRNKQTPSAPPGENWSSAVSFKELLNDGMKRQADRKQKVEDLLNEQNHKDRLLDE
ncbi:flagellar biosynthetic protein FliO [Paenibacillus sp. MWE-103]|uniref:Flagellar biosynthetic protein FliO n=1 Tax=Paenibacillus artemisiicola TaxID=1172618 RepID=A0ABS3WHT5_9BACL|nr:flagellar biosynthetic protein FliO [Paenibacillus artemisiicola]MBO7747884.1 flagellar biosynthetic protein FliO [Paenibacillus artemisiicola]